MATIGTKVITIKRSAKSGGSKKGRQHMAHARKSQRQWARTAANKEANWVLHEVKHPNDIKAKEAIKEAKKTLKWSK